MPVVWMIRRIHQCKYSGGRASGGQSGVLVLNTNNAEYAHIYIYYFFSELGATTHSKQHCGAIELVVHGNIRLSITHKYILYIGTFCERMEKVRVELDDSPVWRFNANYFNYRLVQCFSGVAVCWRFW